VKKIKQNRQVKKQQTTQSNPLFLLQTSNFFTTSGEASPQKCGGGLQTNKQTFEVDDI